jgi:hypothetical protein
MMRLALLPAVVLGHGAMNFPRPRNSNAQSVFSADASCIGEACCACTTEKNKTSPVSRLSSLLTLFITRSPFADWYQVGCFNGCSNCTGEGKYLYAKPSDYPQGCTPAEPTNNKPEHRSWDPKGLSQMGDFTKHNPWRSPGKAPVRDSCGASSGYIKPSPYAETPKGYAPWTKGSEVLPEGPVTVWKAGGVAEVAWSIAAQHGGGYSYRLCPKGSTLDEECFQSHPLAFVGGTHTIRYNDGSKKDFEINATQITDGVTPKGSTWRRNPIPGCNCDIGNKCMMGGKGFSAAYENAPEPLSSKVCPTGTMFPALFEDGAGDVGVLTGHPLHYSIVDKVAVPTAEGEYVLSWRWDCEQTNQVSAGTAYSLSLS